MEFDRFPLHFADSSIPLHLRTSEDAYLSFNFGDVLSEEPKIRIDNFSLYSILGEAKQFDTDSLKSFMSEHEDKGVILYNHSNFPLKLISYGVLEKEPEEVVSIIKEMRWLYKHIIKHIMENHQINEEDAGVLKSFEKAIQLE